MSFLESALHLASLGYYVFPLLPGRKTPPAGMHFKEMATRDPDKLRAWWERNPNYNVGVYTGRFGDDEALFIVDVDVKEGKRGRESLMLLDLDIPFPRTAEQTTASGGMHLLMRVPTAVKQGVNVLGPGLDIRSRGGYIVGPGSVVNGAEYTWRNGERLPALAPQALIDRIPKEAESRKPANPVQLDSDAALAAAMAYLRTEAEHAVAGDAGNPTTYNVAARLKDLGVTQHRAGLLMLNCYNDDCIPPWPQGDLLKIVASAYKSTDNELGCDSPEADFSSVAPAPIQKPRPALLDHILAGDQILAELEASLHRPWLIRDILPSRTPLVTLYGPPKTGKSLLAFGLALSIASGLPWQGLATTQAPVLYLAAEGKVGAMKRIAAWTKHHGVPIPKDFRILTRPVHLNTLNQMQALAASIEWLCEHELEQALGLIVIDTLAHCMAGDENSTADMSALVTACMRLHQLTGATVLIVHHSGKDQSKGMRGSTALLGAVDLALRLERDDELTTMHCAATRDVEEFEPIAFTAEMVYTGYQADTGFDMPEPVTSYVMVRHGGSSDSAEGSDIPGKLSSRQAEVLDVLAEITDNGEKSVTEKEWRVACQKRIKGDEYYARYRAFRRSSQILERMGLVEVSSGRVLLVDGRRTGPP